MAIFFGSRTATDDEAPSISGYPTARKRDPIAFSGYATARKRDAAFNDGSRIAIVGGRPKIPGSRTATDSFEPA
jgi:hypothetical protein